VGTKRGEPKYSLGMGHHFLREKGPLGNFHEIFSHLYVVHYFFKWAVTSARTFFKVKHRTWIVESTCSIFFPMAPLAQFFFQQFLLCKNFFSKIAQPPSPPFKKIMVYPLHYLYLKQVDAMKQQAASDIRNNFMMVSDFCHF